MMVNSNKIDEKTLMLNMLNSRYIQLILNENIKKNTFKIPIHLALGHEAISEALNAAMQFDDKLICSHRNVHYNIARGAQIYEIVEEFKLTNKGISKGQNGSMNLSCPKNSILYSSSILGNNLSVGVGVALSKKMKKEEGIVFIITGDGAMEEGAFYESIECARSFDLPIVFFVENNEWSLASKISQRRKQIDLKKLASSLGADYTYLSGNNILEYYNEITRIREKVSLKNIPEILEINLKTLGDWILVNELNPNGKEINYHAGLAPELKLENGPIIQSDHFDPIFLIREILGQNEFESLCSQTQKKYSEYLS